jgi:uncharacterized membrane protein
MYLALGVTAKTMEKRRNPETTIYWDHWIENHKEKLSVIGGVLAVVLLVLMMIKMPQWQNVIWIALIALGILFGIFTFGLNDRETNPYRRAKPKSPEPTQAAAAPEIPYRPVRPYPAPPPVKEDYYRKLVAKARYDQGLVDRLLEYERKRLPNASFDELCKSAIERLEQDNN